MNYGTLTGPKSATGSIRSWINYDPLDVEGVLLDAQAYIYGRIRVREMLSSAFVTLTEGSETAPLPDSFLDPIKFTLPDGNVIEPIGEASLLSNRPRNYDNSLVSAAPFAYSIWDELIQLNTKPDMGYAATMLFYKRPAYLSRLNPSNFLCTRYPNLLRVAALMHGADQMQDDAEYMRWKARTDELIGSISVETDLAGRGRDYAVSVR